MLVHNIGISAAVVATRQRAAPTKSTAAVACSIWMLISASVYIALHWLGQRLQKVCIFPHTFDKNNDHNSLIDGESHSCSTSQSCKVHIELHTTINRIQCSGYITEQSLDLPAIWVSCVIYVKASSRIHLAGCLFSSCVTVTATSTRLAGLKCFSCSTCESYR
jgi:hypothetical protein